MQGEAHSIPPNLSTHADVLGDMGLGFTLVPITFPRDTIFLRSDAAATVYFTARFVRLLFEGGYYSRAAFISLESPETSTAG